MTATESIVVKFFVAEILDITSPPPAPPARFQTFIEPRQARRGRNDLLLVSGADPRVRERAPLT
jgi:hypothetical protein